MTFMNGFRYKIILCSLYIIHISKEASDFDLQAFESWVHIFKIRTCQRCLAPN